MKDLILTCLHAQSIYTSARITSPKDKLYYLDQIKEIRQYIQTFENYVVLLAVIEKALTKIKPSWFSLNKDLKYRMLAVQQASEIVIAIHNRFNGKLYAQG